jgi:hypothetical protein
MPMKWAPTLVVLGAFALLLWLTSNQPEQLPASAAAGAPAAAAGKPAGAGPAAAAPVSAAQEAPPIEVVKPPDSGAPVPARRQDVAGVVKDPSGNGVPGILVRLTSPDGKDSRRARTDGQGRFGFEGVPAGTFTLVASDPDFLYTTSTRTSVTAKGDQAAEVSLEVRRGTSGVRGTLTDGSGRPLPDRRVTLGAGGAEISVLTDAKGAFVVNGLAAGEWRVTPDGMARLSKSVRLGEGAQGAFEFSIRRPASVELTVTGSPLHHAELKGGEKALLRRKNAGDAAPREAPLAIETKSGEVGSHEPEVAGVARFVDLEPGEYELEVVDPAGTKSVLQLGDAWSAPISLLLREGDARPIVLPTARAALGRGTEVPGWIKLLMIAGIALLVLATPLLFPPPLVPRRPAKAAAQGS